MGVTLLPSNATAFDKAASQSIDVRDVLGVEVTNFRSFRYKSLSATAKLALMIEYGLTPLLAFGVTSDQAWSLGRAFLEKRGTAAAVNSGLSMLGLSGSIEENPLRRRRWNLFQLGLAALPAQDVPDLRNLAGLTQFAVAERSRFVRGFKFYDVRAAETSYKRTSGAMLSDSSGTRIEDNPVKWSFGRPWDNSHTLTQAELTALGVWIAPSTDPFTWANANFPWSLATFPWGTPVNSVRAGIMAALLGTMGCWTEFKDSGGNVIGYRKCRALHQVAAAGTPPGLYQVGSNGYDLASPSSPLLYAEAMTGFGDGLGHAAATVALRFGATPAAGQKPGAVWLGPGQLTMPLAAVAVTNFNITFRRTVRERVRFLLGMT